MLREVLCHLIEFLEGLSLCICVLLFQLISFALCFVASLLLAFGLAAIINSVWNYELPTFIIALIQGLFLISSANLSKACDTVLIPTQLARGITRFPIFLGLIPVFVTLSLSLCAIYEIYFQSFNYHLQKVRYTHVDVYVIPEGAGDTGDKKILQNTILLLTNEHGLMVAQFILAFSYLVYNTAKAIKTELKDQLMALQLINPQQQQFATLVGAFFLLCQFGLTVAYSIPLFYSYIIVNYLVIDTGILFFYISIIGASLGFFGSFLESKEPFPQVKGVLPLFPFEVNVKARIWLLEFLILPFVYFYFFEHPIIPAQATVSFKQNKSEQSDKNILFTLIFALLLLHTVKILSISMFIPRINQNQRLRRRQRHRHQIEAAAAAANNLHHLDEQPNPIGDDAAVQVNGVAVNAVVDDLDPTTTTEINSQEDVFNLKNNNNSDDVFQGLAVRNTNRFLETQIQIEVLEDVEVDLDLGEMKGDTPTQSMRTSVQDSGSGGGGGALQSLETFEIVSSDNENSRGQVPSLSNNNLTLNE